VLVSERRVRRAASRSFRPALATLRVTPSEVVTDEAPTYPRVFDEFVPAAWHHVEQLFCRMPELVTGGGVQVGLSSLLDLSAVHGVAAFRHLDWSTMVSSVPNTKSFE
jgi:hypothetical protein